jgi:hypothetical protein
MDVAHNYTMHTMPLPRNGRNAPAPSNDVFNSYEAPPAQQAPPMRGNIPPHGIWNRAKHSF